MSCEYRLKTGVEIERIGNGGAIMLPDGSIGMLNETGASMVEMIAEGVDKRRVVCAVSERYGKDSKVIANDLADFLGELTAAGVIELERSL